MFKPRPRRPGVWPWASHSDRGRGAARLEARDGGGAGAPCKAPWFCPFCGVVPGKHLRPENPTSQPPPQLWAVPQGVRELTRDLVLRCPHPPGALGWCSRAPSWASRALRPLWSRAASTPPLPPNPSREGPLSPGIPFPKEVGSRRQTLQNLQTAVGGRSGDGADEPELPAGQGLDLAAGGSRGGRVGACFPGPSRDAGVGGEGKSPARGCTTGVRPGAGRPGCPRAHGLPRQRPCPEPPLVSTVTVLGAQRRPSRLRGRGDVAAARGARGVSRLGSRTGRRGRGNNQSSSRGNLDCSFLIYLFMRDAERGRDLGRGRSFPAGSPIWDSIPGPRGHGLSRRQTLHRCAPREPPDCTVCVDELAWLCPRAGPLVSPSGPRGGGGTWCPGMEDSRLCLRRQSLQTRVGLTMSETRPQPLRPRVPRPGAHGGSPRGRL